MTTSNPETTYPPKEWLEDDSAEIVRVVTDLMITQRLNTVLDSDYGGDDRRPGRGYYILKTLFWCLTRMYGDRRTAADALVLSAVRVASEQLRVKQ